MAHGKRTNGVIVLGVLQGVESMYLLVMGSIAAWFGLANIMQLQNRALNGLFGFFYIALGLAGLILFIWLFAGSRIAWAFTLLSSVLIILFSATLLFVALGNEIVLIPALVLGVAVLVAELSPSARPFFQSRLEMASPHADHYDDACEDSNRYCDDRDEPFRAR